MARRMVLWVAVCLSVLGYASWGQGGARGILVETLRPGLTLAVDKGCGATYVHDELLTVTVRSDRAGYLTLFDFMPDGKVQLIFPNQYHQDAQIQGETTVKIPGEILPFRFRIQPPDGEETLFAVVTESKVDLLPEQYVDFAKAFPQLPGTHEETAHDLVRGVGVIPTGTWWAAAMCWFNVQPTATVTTPTTTPGGEGWALFAGVDAYDETPYTGEDGLKYYFPKLRYCAKGARDMATALKSTFPTQKLLLDTEVTHNAVEEAITQWLAQAPEGATVLIYFSGHGSRMKDTSGDEADNYDETIVPWDYGSKHRFIVDDEISRWTSTLKADRVILIFDSCHSGTMERNAYTARLLTTGARTVEPPLTDGMAEDFGTGTGARGTWWKQLVITGCKPNESSYEDSGLQSGVLTYYLLQALAGKGDTNGDRWVTAQEAYLYSATHVPANYPKQHPQMTDKIQEAVRLAQPK
jgi:hypothetical protein